MPVNENKCSDVKKIRKGIAKALKNTGNIPYFLDTDPHNENIYQRMIDEIRNCRFLVADLTSQNNGAYFEAGMAKGMGKTVIFTCKKSDAKNLHFDVKQLQIVFWENSKDLAKKLSKQIIGSGLNL